MRLPTSVLSLATTLISFCVPRSSRKDFDQDESTKWFGTLPPTTADPLQQGSLVSACTFAVGPPGPDFALCPSFLQYCHDYKEQVTPHIVSLKSRPLSPSLWRRTSSPLEQVRFRAGCAGGSSLASDGTYISGYTASCVVDGTERIALVFDNFIRAQFSDDGEQDPAIYYSFIGCQVPAHHA